MELDYEVVWSGRDALLPDRNTGIDHRYETLSSFDTDEEDLPKVEATKRKYCRSGKYKGFYKNGRNIPLAEREVMNEESNQGEVDRGS